ncbi:hypothetical protein ACFQL1_21870 [Halomicroarcula sp. GCM10025709]
MEVGTDSALDRGALACDLHGVSDEAPNGTVALDLDVEGFRRLLTDTLEDWLADAPS